MRTHKTLEVGYGLEMEGFVVTEEGLPVSLTAKSQPLIEWLLQQWLAWKPQAANLLSAEQLAHMVEIKTPVVTTIRQALDHISYIRSELNILLRQAGKKGLVRRGARIIFSPVLSRKAALIPASTDPSSRAYQLVEAWSKTPVGAEQLHNTSIASCQLNDSVLFAGLSVEQRWMLAVALYNQYTHANVSNLMDRYNVQGATNFAGRTRQQCLEALLPAVKGHQFAKRGYDHTHVIYPPCFRDKTALQAWYCAHSDVEDFTQAKCKDAHGIALKVKLDHSNNPLLAESRWLDANEDLGNLLKALEGVVMINQQVRSRINSIIMTGDKEI